MNKQVATLSQRFYIQELVENCEQKNIELPCEILDEIREGTMSKERAGDIINNLKFELGWG